MNAFVDYLNSMHNIKGDGLGALAERQIYLYEIKQQSC